MMKLHSQGKVTLKSILAWLVTSISIDVCCCENIKTSNMNVTHICSLPLHANPGRLDPCIGRHWIALPITKTVVGLWKISEVAKSPIELSGHSNEINALCFSNDRIKYLLSACNEQVFMWDLLSESDGNISYKPFCSVPDEVSTLCINNNVDTVAAGVHFKILLFKEGKACPLAVLQAHRGIITKLAFCPHFSATLVSLSDDRSFCVWDIQDSILLFQSKIISSSPLISVSMNWTCPHLAIGTADGYLKVFDLADGNNFRQLSNTNVSLALQKHCEKKLFGDRTVPSTTKMGKQHVKQHNAHMNSADNSANITTSESVLSVDYVYFSQECSQENPYNIRSSGIGDILNEKPPLLCVITTSAILQMNSRTFEILKILNIQSPMFSLSFCGTKTVGILSYAASCQVDSTQVLAIIGTMFENRIEVVQFEICDKGEVNLDKSDKMFKCLEVEENMLSIIPTSTLLSSSPLMSEMLPSIASDSVTKADIATGKSKLSIMNQPLTFKSKIKSSGYLQGPRQTMFKPETSRNKLLNLSDPTKVKTKKISTALGKMLRAEYDISKGPPLYPYDTFQVDKHCSAVFNLRFSDDGSTLGCALANSCALTLKSPYNRHISKFFVGHNNTVNSVYWGSNNEYLLTSSNDRTALLWDKIGGDPILSISHLKGTVREFQPKQINSSSMLKLTPSSPSCRKLKPLSSKDQSPTTSENKLFSKEIKHAQFYYLDKFILLTHGNELLLYKYHIALDRDDIQSYKSQNRYKLVSSWQTDSCLLTATAAVNMFFSHLVICMTSGRTMEIYDLNKSTLAHVFTECHSRPAHSVIINEGSCFASQKSEAHNVIASASPTDPIKLWDLRTKSNVLALQGHVNNAYACQIAFSPCGQYLASGSENQMVYVFDLRKGTYIDRLRGHNEVITSVAFHPGFPFLASGSLNDGSLKVRVFEFECRQMCLGVLPNNSIFY